MICSEHTAIVLRTTIDSCFLKGGGMLAVVWRSERLHLLVCDIRRRGPQALELPPKIATEGSGRGRS